MEQTLEELYKAMAVHRDPWLDAARQFSALTAPHVLPEEGRMDPQNRVIPNSSLASIGAITLASKVTMEALPVNRAFFRMVLKPGALQELSEAERDEAARPQVQKIRNEIQASLVDLENRVVKEVGRGNLRANVHETLLHLIVAGSVILHIPEKGDTTVFDLRQFVTERDPTGKPLITIIREDFAEATLSPVMLEVWDGATMDPNPEVGSAYASTGSVPVYTGIRWEDGKYRVWQEISGVEIPGSSGTFDEDSVPYLVLRWKPQIGEHYSPGYVWDFEGALRFVEGLTEAVKDGAALSSRFIGGVRPTAPPGLEGRLSKSKNGQFHRFSAEDVFFVRADKGQDLAISYQALNDAKMELRQAFLMHTTRDAERVTAFELRQNAAELQTTLGGSYANLGPTFQKPMLRRLMRRLKANGGLAGLEDALGETEPVIITGVDAIGRNGELNNLLTFAETYRAAVGAQADQTLDPHGWADRIATATSVNPQGLILDPETIQSNTNQNALREGAVRAGPNIAAQIAPGDNQ